MTRSGQLALCLVLALFAACGSDRHGSGLYDGADAGDATRSSGHDGQNSGNPDSSVATSKEECRVRLLRTRAKSCQPPL